MSDDSKESYVDYRKRMMDPISASFCAAKWYNATIWLGSGTTASCHHPPAHRISQPAIERNCRALHNTAQKKLARAQMLRGERPLECNYCWKIEDLKADNISDRVFKTVIYDDESVNHLATEDAFTDVVPKTLEIAFDRKCNFACSYCNSSFSTKWSQDILKNGPYRNLYSDGSQPFQIDGNWAAPFENSDENPFIQAFWKWWPELAENLTELRITGGEPLLSSDLWALFERVKSNKSSSLRLAINSNLGVSQKYIDKLIAVSNEIDVIDLYTSCEAYGVQAEYIRDGLVFENFRKNVEKALFEGGFREIHLMMTVGSLSIFSLTEFLDVVLDWRRRTGSHFPAISVNLLRFPSFMNVSYLPEHLREICYEKLSEWLGRNGELIRDFEQEGLKRLLSVLEAPVAPQEELHKNWSDFRSYFAQYDQRRGKSFKETFPEPLVNWYLGLETMELKFQKDDEDASLAGIDIESLQELALREGYVLVPDDSD